MKLYISTPSPYARLCRIVARERGLRWWPIPMLTIRA